MKPVLILTKNLLMERRIQEQLQQLNYEVFCSVQMANHIRTISQSAKVVQEFQIIIFSETMTNTEIKRLLPLMTIENKLVVRKLADEPLEQEIKELKGIGIDTWICENQSLDYLRELLAVNLIENQKKENENIVFLYQTEDSPRTLNEFKNRLTKKERKAFESLLENEGRLVSRELLCKDIWQGASNNSRLTQLSVLVKRIKAKLNEEGFQEDLIETVWGYGYRLSPKLLEFYDQEIMK